MVVAITLWLVGGHLRLPEWMRATADRRAEAISAYEKRDWERAADLSRLLLKTAGDDVELLRVYARASARLDRDGPAAAIYRDRLGSARLETEDQFLVGLGLARGGKLLNAWEQWDKATKSGPDHPEMLDHFARLSARLQRLDEAADAARRLARQPGWEARGWLVQADIQGLLENPKGASDAVRQGLTFNAGTNAAPFPLAHYQQLLAQSLLQLGRATEAIEPIEAILKNPSAGADAHRQANWLLSRAWLRQGRIAEATAARERSGSYRDENPLVPEPSPYVGEARCESCHSRESRAHEQTRHARTFHRGRALLELPVPDHPLADPDDLRVTHTFARDDGRIRVRTRAGDRVFHTIVEYAFGVRDRYVTMVGRDDEKTYRALRLSSYHAAGGVRWGATAGDVSDIDSAENVRGQRMQIRDGVVRCLYCHVTQSRDFRDPAPEPGPGPEAADKGIGCERCHGPAGNHLAAIKANFPDRAIVNTGTTSASAIVTQCADCHIVGIPDEIRQAPEDPKYVRSPGVTLTLSRCYTESDGGMSCLTCHDPHSDDNQPVSFFEGKCLGCHGPTATARKSCPVNASKGCLECHMPKVPVAVLHTSLTDHYIRAHKKP
jgi:tetratricopeptide (TPR) repeat protein